MQYTGPFYLEVGKVPPLLLSSVLMAAWLFSVHSDSPTWVYVESFLTLSWWNELSDNAPFLWNPQTTYSHSLCSLRLCSAENISRPSGLLSWAYRGGHQIVINSLFCQRPSRYRAKKDNNNLCIWCRSNFSCPKDLAENAFTLLAPEFPFFLSLIDIICVLYYWSNNMMKKHVIHTLHFDPVFQ